MPSPITGQVSVTGSAQQLTTPISHTAFTIKAPISNSNPVYVGNSTVTTSTGYQLDPGDEFEYERGNQNGNPGYQLSVSDFYAVGTGGDKVVWFASP